jgi:hypothetical protein
VFDEFVISAQGVLDSNDTELWLGEQLLYVPKREMKLSWLAHF